MNQVYGSWLEHMMDVYFKSDDHFTDDSVELFVCGVGAGYTFNTSHHEVEDLGINVTLAPRVVEDVTTIHGLINASNVETTITTEAGSTVNALILFVANDDGSQLIAYIDEGQPTQLPMNLIEGDFVIRWNPAGILRI